MLVTFLLSQFTSLLSQFTFKTEVTRRRRCTCSSPSECFRCCSLMLGVGGCPSGVTLDVSTFCRHVFFVFCVSLSEPLQKVFCLLCSVNNYREDGRFLLDSTGLEKGGGGVGGVCFPSSETRDVNLGSRPCWRGASN